MGFIDYITLHTPAFLSGLAVTAKLVTVSFALGTVLGMLVAVARLSKFKLVCGWARVYIYFFRGSPILAQLFLLYYGLGSFRPFWQEVSLWWFFRDPWNCALLAFTLNTAAYQAEILRGAYSSVMKGQFEACSVLGLSKTTTFIKVILPQMLIVAVGPLGNELILMVKASAVASLVTIFDLMGTAKLIFSRTFDFQAYLWVALMYLMIVELIRRVLKIVETRLTKHIS